MQHAIAYVTPGEFYGAKAFLNVWAPNVTGNDFSISQIWVIADAPNHGVNTIEAGWRVSCIQNIRNLNMILVFSRICLNIAYV